jgi:LysM repeat protein
MYRGALVTLVVASLIALFLFIRPPESKSVADTVRTLATATSAGLVTATPTPPGGGATRAATVAASQSSTPSASTTPRATVSPSATAAPKTYTVKPGDTLSGIARDNGTTVEAIQALNPGVSPQNLQAGAVITLP